MIRGAAAICNRRELAFVPVDGQSLFDIVPPERRPPMQALVDSEGEGWLLPRFAPAPFKHFTEPLRLTRSAEDRPPSTYIRCVQWPHAGFDRYAENARSTPGWSHYELSTSHIPYVTDPDAVHDVLVELCSRE